MSVELEKLLREIKTQMVLDSIDLRSVVGVGNWLKVLILIALIVLIIQNF